MKRRLLAIAVSGVGLAAAVYAPVSAATAPADSAKTRFTCSAGHVTAPAGTEVESVTADLLPAGTFQVPGEPPLGGYPVPDVPARCEVTVTLTHPGADDHATVRVWLPRSGWNGRFQALGGSAYAAGDSGGGLAAAIQQGYAAATTDAGVGGALDTSWALNDSGQVDTALLENFADRSQHEMALVGKEVIADVYSKAASYSYWNGCSTGGRQGYMEAQRHPDDFDGILANAPAVNWNQFEVASLWPQVVMNEKRTYPSSCEFNAFNQAAVKACDGLDGIKDGLIGDPGRCDYDPRKLIGTKVVCDGAQTTITAADAAVVRKIWDGPRSTSGKRLWYGLPIGASFDYLAASTGTDGTVHGVPFLVPSAWVSTFVKKQPSFDTSKLTYAQFEKIFRQARAEYDDVIGTADPDLSAFRDSGGKLLTWHGGADQLIPTAGTVDYRERVERAMGGSKRVDDFYRLFLAPGTAHCALSGKTDDLAALTAWVEDGKAPDTLPATLTNAGGETVERDLCRYPKVSRHTGRDAADGFRCIPAARH
ncbi:feruloyl esterase [Actinocorallia herbida]|uniref:Feruloyl esterase n=1 Tax=Actinocorallia herbida TaxID=58109 RepID=A0A3N1D2K2_9ACTN|nr:tannase/feruloyl esterase family alpha/beta hydrolase [Actinocorallia herbida]ROO87764.1 feruloyl esterase [Actinocorallia herbida]